jgi:GDP-4-dehydro-6-deoxy-D-mannose reductase
VPARLLPGALAAQVVAAEQGGSRTIRIGRLDSSRDFLDVRDAARAYHGLAVARATRPGVFNVCAGMARSALSLAEHFIAAAQVPVELVHDTSRLQVGDVDTQCGTPARIARTTGWEPEISFEASVRAMLEWERTAARASR